MKTCNYITHIQIQQNEIFIFFKESQTADGTQEVCVPENTRGTTTIASVSATSSSGIPMSLNFTLYADTQHFALRSRFTQRVMNTVNPFILAGTLFGDFHYINFLAIMVTNIMVCLLIESENIEIAKVKGRHNKLTL